MAESDLSNQSAVFWRAVLRAFAERTDPDLVPIIEELDDEKVTEGGQALLKGTVFPIADILGRTARVAVDAYKQKGPRPTPPDTGQPTNY